MVLVCKYGKMVLSMKENGKIIVQMGEVNFGMLMVITLKENGKMIKHVERVFIYILMVQNMKGIGRMIYNMDLELNHGQIQLDLKDSTNMVKKRDKVNIFGLMVLYI